MAAPDRAAILDAMQAAQALVADPSFEIVEGHVNIERPERRVTFTTDGIAPSLDAGYHDVSVAVLGFYRANPAT